MVRYVALLIASLTLAVGASAWLVRASAAAPKSLTPAATLALGLGPVTDVTSITSEVWAQQQPTATPGAPTHRWVNLAYDAATSTAVLYINGGTWTWNGLNWTAICGTTSPSTAACALPSRNGAAMAYDPANSSIMLFGGTAGIGSFLSDGWTWNGTSWTAVCGTTTPATAACGPSVRKSPSMAYDAVNSQLLLFGGEDTNGPLGDAWSWNGTTWTAVCGTTTPATAACGPSARRAEAMVADAGHSQIVLFGGRDTSGNSLSDTWTWNGSAWTQQCGPSPFATACGPTGREAMSMAYDAASATVILFGGCVDSLTTHTCASFLGDTWSWNGSAWTQQCGPSPFATACPITPRHNAGAADGSGTTPLLLFGGVDASLTDLDETWVFGVAPTVSSVSPSSGPASGGTTVTIAGSGFSTTAGATMVNFVPAGGSPSSANAATNVSCSSASQCTATSPAGQGTVDVQVRVSGVPSATSAADQFTFLLRLGDVNGDGSVNAVDALCVLRIVATLPSTSTCPSPPPGNPCIATNEPSCPGTPPSPTAVDALCILRAVAGLPATADCPALAVPATHTVQIVNFAFNPSTITIAAGDTVMWTNQPTSVTHTTTSDTGLWDSGFLSPGSSFSFTFTAAGTFGFHCNIHTFMTGTITVMPYNPATGTEPGATTIR